MAFTVLQYCFKSPHLFFCTCGYIVNIQKIGMSWNISPSLLQKVPFSAILQSPWLPEDISGDFNCFICFFLNLVKLIWKKLTISNFLLSGRWDHKHSSFHLPLHVCVSLSWNGEQALFHALIEYSGQRYILYHTAAAAPSTIITTVTIPIRIAFFFTTLTSPPFFSFFCSFLPLLYFPFFFLTGFHINLFQFLHRFRRAIHQRAVKKWKK